MSKAILVMDMPSCCLECPFSNVIDECGIMEYEDVGDVTRKPSWCPLREVPQKKDTKYHPARNPYVTQGYNACIDEILGECKDG